MIHRFLLRFIACAASAVVFALGSWLLVFAMPFTAAWTLLAAVVPARVALGRAGRRDVWASALLGGVGLLGAWVPYVELADRLDALAAAKDARGAAAFDTRDVLGVYGLNLVMAAGGYAAGFPEVADETLGLLRGAPLDVRSDFAMRSPKVRRAVAAMLAEAQAGEAPGQHTIAWSGYVRRDESMRVALALNTPLYLEGEARDTDEGLVLDVVGTAWIAYPRTWKLPLAQVGGRALVLDEGLFWVLQEQGVMKPYTATWRWSVPADDPRLDELSRPVLGFRERLLVSL